ncbi:unnamed protein product [Bursaphelenchus okinawaensis]|uniref:NADH dehydrogenase [ubiquinone] 1 alpha subcomplex subunit 13 n=1 Tax=Bursaphelenchus okinawaensis TaxID=465554 RepID=A0A811JRZ5_9BILA|nr:unnamed protein product [Bursaphelenchus okinawaensis]CAG9080876.1 unnamed protein product [Bursaphelenchus okinawaensis]
MPNKGYRQDLPPEGGYRKFNWERTYARKLFRPIIVIPVISAACTYGVYQTWSQQRQLITRKFEDTDLHTAMEPFLKAERDRKYLKTVKRNFELEEEIMKDVPGWQTGTWYGEPVYFTMGDKWWDLSHYEMFAHVWHKKKYDEMLWRHHTDYSAPKFYDKWIPESIKAYLW